MVGLRVGKNEVYQYNIAILKKYRDDYYKITLHASLRKAGYEEISSEKGKKNTVGNDCKLNSSLSRTKSSIFELAMCNSWEYFVTMTLNKEIHDRTDLNNYKKKLSKWLNNYNRLHNVKIKYLLIPELHNDKLSWHIHGLMSGIPIDELNLFEETEKLPIKILILIKQGRQIYNWQAYVKAFGYITLENIINAESVAKYITKYITKEVLSSRISVNDHLYYSSQGLNRAEVLHKNYLTKEFEPDFANEYVKTKIFRSFDEAIEHFTNP